MNTLWTYGATWKTDGKMRIYCPNIFQRDIAINYEDKIFFSWWEGERISDPLINCIELF